MKKKKELVILHFAPLEIYPPVINLGVFLSKFSDPNINITILTTFPELKIDSVEIDNIKVIRFKGIEPNNSKFEKAARYFKIYFSMFIYLIKVKPTVVLYFETLSSLPILLYKKIFKNVSVFIHYHELVTKEELMDGRSLNKFLNIAEEKLYLKAAWISHTNIHRLELFHTEFPFLKGSVLKAMPNYPSSSWLKAPKQALDIKQDNVTKLVHIGALSLKGMYLEKVLKHFGDNPSYSITFYSHKFTEEVNELISNYNNCSIKGSIAYQDIPTLKGLYDVGLVLYNGSSLNFTYNAPNKIFEYLALGLDVWCSDKLITARDYQISETFPKMVMVDYTNLSKDALKEIISHDGLKFKESPYVYEKVYYDLLNKINESFNS